MFVILFFIVLAHHKNLTFIMLDNLINSFFYNTVSMKDKNKIGLFKCIFMAQNGRLIFTILPLFRRKWEGEVQNLTDAVDEIVTIGDFLAVSEAHILEDVTQCVSALQAKELDNLDRTAGAIQGRVQRVHQVVLAEMDNYEPDYYTDKVREDTLKLMEQITPIFTQRVAAVIDALDKDPPDEIDENDFIGNLIFF